jgi:hypothetical protein
MCHTLHSISNWLVVDLPVRHPPYKDWVQTPLKAQGMRSTTYHNTTPNVTQTEDLRPLPVVTPLRMSFSAPPPLCIHCIILYSSSYNIPPASPSTPPPLAGGSPTPPVPPVPPVRRPRPHLCVVWSVEVLA